MLVTRLFNDVSNVKAFLDSRMLQVIHASASVVVNLIIALVDCWQAWIIDEKFSSGRSTVQSNSAESGGSSNFTGCCYAEAQIATHED